MCLRLQPSINYILSYLLPEFVTFKPLLLSLGIHACWLAPFDEVVLVRCLLFVGRYALLVFIRAWFFKLLCYLLAVIDLRSRVVDNRIIFFFDDSHVCLIFFLVLFHLLLNFEILNLLSKHSSFNLLLIYFFNLLENISLRIHLPKVAINHNFSHLLELIDVLNLDLSILY